MAKIVGTRGSGITEQAVVKFDVSLDLSEIVAAAKHSIMMESFSAIQASIADTAKSILDACELPSDPRGHYLYKNGSWAQLDVPQTEPGDFENFLRLLQLLKIEPDSAEGFAAQALVLIEQINASLTEKVDSAQALIFELGGLLREATFKSAWEKDALRGEKIQRAAERGDAMPTSGPKLSRPLRPSVLGGPA
jgi:hypothetical protein